MGIDYETSWREQAQTIGRMQIKIERLETEIAYRDRTIDELRALVHETSRKLNEINDRYRSSNP